MRCSALTGLRSSEHVSGSGNIGHIRNQRQRCPQRAQFHGFDTPFHDVHLSVRAGQPALYRPCDLVSGLGSTEQRIDTRTLEVSIPPLGGHLV